MPDGNRVSLDTPRDLHRLLKMLAAHYRMSLRDYCIAAIERQVELDPAAQAMNALDREQARRRQVLSEEMERQRAAIVMIEDQATRERLLARLDQALADPLDYHDNAMRWFNAAARRTLLDADEAVEQEAAVAARS